MMELSEIRQKINKIDKELLSLFLNRMELAAEASDKKSKAGLPILDMTREDEILKDITASSGEMAQYSRRLFNEILLLSRNYQTQLRLCQSSGSVDVGKKRSGDNIIIIGMPGCGKSAIARAVAELSGRLWADVDSQVENMAGKPITRIFEDDGEAAFRTIERAAVERLCAMPQMVIATGGGSILDIRNCDSIKKSGRVYLKLRPIEELRREGRPLCSSQEALREIERDRMPIYEALADMRIGPELNAEEASAAIWEDFSLHSANKQ